MSRALRSIIRISEILIDVTEIMVIVFVGVSLFLTIYSIINNTWRVLADLASSSIQMLLSDVFAMIIYAEILRSVVILMKEKGASFIYPLSEVGFIIAVKELLASAVKGTTLEVLCSALVFLIIVIAIYIIRARIRVEVAKGG